MPNVEWRMKGQELSSCNCEWGCPCQFNSLPSHGDCRAAVAMEIAEGHFGETSLDGLRWVALLAWPGPIHQGDGEAQIVVDARADDAQRAAILTIVSGGETEPGATIFNVFSTTYSRVHDPIFAPIEFEADIEARTGRFAVQGLVESVTEPIRNPVTDQPQRVSVNLPDGFEYTTAEYASSTVSSGGVIALEWSQRHAHLVDLHMTQNGVVR